MSLLLGTHYHPGKGTTLARQHRARRSLLGLNGVKLVNLQFPDAVVEVGGIETCPRLLNDSCKASGNLGVRKPIGNEAFTRLAEAAKGCGCRYFAWVNADIVVTQEAVDLVLREDFESYIFSRQDFSGATGRDTRSFWGGQDMFAIEVAWWESNQSRFRAYVNSESYWDNVYAAILLCHSRGNLLTRGNWIRHEEHPRAWEESPFTAYNTRLAALDDIYYQKWDRYEAGITQSLSKGCWHTEEPSLRERVFCWPPTAVERLKQVPGWLRRTVTGG